MHQKLLYFILSRPARHEALLLDTGHGLTLPAFESPVDERIGFADPAPFNQWVRDHFGIDVRRRYACEQEGADIAYFILEATPGPHTLPTGARWVNSADAANLATIQPEHRAFVQHWLADSPNSVTIPWSRPNGFQPALEWMTDTLAAHRMHIAGAPEQIKNAYVSTVFHYPTSTEIVTGRKIDRKDVYLKILPPVFAREAEIIQELATWNIIRLPRTLALDIEQGWMLTADMGGYDLIERCTLEMLEAVVRDYAAFQVAAVHRVQNALPDPFYDYSTSTLGAHLANVVADIPSLLANSPYQLTPAESQRLHASLPAWQQLCRALQEAGIPDSLDHGDLRPENIRVTEQGFIFYDWAWSAITHPFLSVTAFLHIVRHSLEDPQRDKERLRAAYLDAWTGYLPIASLQRVFALADKVKTAYGVVVDALWIRAIQKALGDTHPGPTSADACTLRWRQYYFAKMARRLLDI